MQVDKPLDVKFFRGFKMNYLCISTVIATIFVSAFHSFASDGPNDSVPFVERSFENEISSSPAHDSDFRKGEIEKFRQEITEEFLRFRLQIEETAGDLAPMYLRVIHKDPNLIAYEAVMRNRLDIIRYLAIEFPEEFLKPNWYRYTAIHAAADLESTEELACMVEFLPKEFFLIETENPEYSRGLTGLSPLDASVRSGNLEAVQIFMNLEPNLGRLFLKKNSTNYTAIHWAVLEAPPKILEYFIEKGATSEQLSIQTANGRSPLHLAADHNKLEMVKLLISKLSSTDINKRDKDGKTALKLAKRSGHSKIVKLLKSRRLCLKRAEFQINSRCCRWSRLFS